MSENRHSTGSQTIGRGAGPLGAEPGDIAIVPGGLPELDEIHAIYCEDFPPEERKSRTQLERLIAAGRYRMLLARQKTDGRLAGYAFVYDAEEALWLDYVAICSQFRGMRYGSRFIQTIAAACGALGMFLEVEIPNSPDPAARALQQRRIGLYERLGARRVNIRYRLPKIDGGYAMLLYFLPADSVHALTREQVGRVVTSVFRNIHSDVPGREELLRAVLATAQDTRFD